METPVAIGVLHHAIAVVVVIAAHLAPIVAVHFEFVVIDEIVARVIGRVDLYHLHFAQLRLLAPL